MVKIITDFNSADFIKILARIDSAIKHYCACIYNKACEDESVQNLSVCSLSDLYPRYADEEDSFVGWNGMTKVILVDFAGLTQLSKMIFLLKHGFSRETMKAVEKNKSIFKNNSFAILVKFDDSKWLELVINENLMLTDKLKIKAVKVNQNENLTPDIENKDKEELVTICEIIVDTDPHISRIHYSIVSKKPRKVLILCPEDTEEVTIKKYIEDHIIDFTQQKSNIEKNKIISTPDHLEKPPMPVTVKKNTTLMSVSERIHQYLDQKKQEAKKNVPQFKKKYSFDGGVPLCLIEGYSVYVKSIHNRFWDNRISAKIVDGNKIYVDVYESVAETLFIESYIREKLDSIILQDYNEKLKTKRISNKRFIDKHSFSYSNPRKDITDEQPLKTLKHKLKYSVIAPVCTEKYIGELSKIPKGMRVVGHDGRLVELNRREDYGLRDKD